MRHDPPGTVDLPAELARYRELRRRAIAGCPPYPADRYSGRGIVIPAGGPRYFTCAWVCIKALRELVGCTLPIEVWYLGPVEMSQPMIDLLEPLGVECVDALARSAPLSSGDAKSLPGALERVPNGWEVKPYAIIHSRFREVIFIDADNVPVVDPTYLLSSAEYESAGALFWPDVYRFDPDNAVWQVFGVPYRDEPAVESGQMVIDKERCWKALHLALHVNERSDFYYVYARGDAATFYFAWRTLEQPYRLSPHPPIRWAGVPCTRGLSQRDFAGRVVFQHRIAPKWNAWAEPSHIPEFRYEEECFAFLRELRDRWDGRVTAAVPAVEAPGNEMNAEEEILQTRRFIYRRVGADERVLELLPDHCVGLGRARCECGWYVRTGEQPCVVVEGVRESGRFGPICVLSRHADGTWRGRWLQFEKMEVELIPIGADEGLPETARGHVRRVMVHGTAEARRRIGMLAGEPEVRPGYSPPDRAVRTYDQLWGAVRDAGRSGDRRRLAVAVRRVATAYENSAWFRERLRQEHLWLPH
jgi:hypothetical protein